MEKLALHACCGPCLLEPYDALSQSADVVTVVYFNPNIHPAEEYDRRRDTLVEYSKSSGIRVVELEYDAAQWLESAGAQASDKRERCRECYRLRLSRVAQWAAANDHDSFATTLTVSPYQDVGAITEEGVRAGAAAGVIYVAADFRELYPDATRRSREIGMYRQNYCGCLMSDIEARRERAERKASKKRASSAG